MRLDVKRIDVKCLEECLANACTKKVLVIITTATTATNIADHNLKHFNQLLIH